jgi:hypothetical protein
MGRYASFIGFVFLSFGLTTGGATAAQPGAQATPDSPSGNPMSPPQLSIPLSPSEVANEPRSLCVTYNGNSCDMAKRVPAGTSCRCGQDDGITQ